MTHRATGSPPGLGNVRLLLLDVDGVMTDGRLIYNADGTESKAFYARDGLGLKLLMAAGVKVGVVTGRICEAAVHRCRSLGIELIFSGVTEKAAVLPEIVEKTGVRPDQMAFVGDDLIDLPLMRRVGVGIAVADAHELVLAAADMVLTKNGGFGAVREVCEEILVAGGSWENVTARFLEQR